MCQVKQPPITFAVLLASVLTVAFPAYSADTLNSVVVPGERAFPESISAASDGTLYVSSLASGGIARINPGASTAETWIKPGAFDSRSTFGVLVDERSNLLWVCSNDVSGMGVPGPSSIPGSYLKGFDLATGEGKISAALPGSYILCNDMTIAADGSIYVTNSRAPQILRLKPDRELEVWLRSSNLTRRKIAGPIAIGGYLYQGRVFPCRDAAGRPGKVTRLTRRDP
jgi:sugar lactone lactonase YvrE